MAPPLVPPLGACNRPSLLCRHAKRSDRLHLLLARTPPPPGPPRSCLGVLVNGPRGATARKCLALCSPLLHTPPAACFCALPTVLPLTPPIHPCTAVPQARSTPRASPLGIARPLAPSCTRWAHRAEGRVGGVGVGAAAPIWGRASRPSSRDGPHQPAAGVAERRVRAGDGGEEEHCVADRGGARRGGDATRGGGGYGGGRHEPRAAGAWRAWGVGGGVSCACRWAWVAFGATAPTPRSLPPTPPPPPRSLPHSFAGPSRPKAARSLPA